ncbi:hypothetical protein ABZP36_025471 [Zizania latifolia]
MASAASSAVLAVLLLFLAGCAAGVAAAAAANETTFRPGEELRRYRRVQALLRRLNKPSLRTIQSPDGDLIDCVAAHLQLAFDHPRLRGQRPLVMLHICIDRSLQPSAALLFVMSCTRAQQVDDGDASELSQDPPERPRGHRRRPNDTADAGVQLWAASGESCPEGSVPIRRTTEADVLRASSVRRFGRAPTARVRRDSVSGGHEHAVGYVAGDEYYGAKASINVWAPKVSTPSEFSLSQIWVIAGSFGNDLNTIEAGWQVSPQLYGDNSPRFFTYWTTDAYQMTGCYNLLCSGFVQTNSKIAMGAAISPTSGYKGGQFDISLLVWKDPNHGNWWLEFGSGELVGYWPSFLFSHLASHASMVQFGGEVVNTRADAGAHTATQMGSGHFAGEGFGKASYFRNLEVVDWDNSLVPLTGFHVTADHPSCYDIQGGVNTVWGNYFYYGGPGKNVSKAEASDPSIHTSIQQSVCLDHSPVSSGLLQLHAGRLGAGGTRPSKAAKEEGRCSSRRQLSLHGVEASTEATHTQRETERFERVFFSASGRHLCRVAAQHYSSLSLAGGSLWCERSALGRSEHACNLQLTTFQAFSKCLLSKEKDED